MLCKKCGAELPDGTETCIFCNAPLNEEEPEENTAENDTVYDENERKRQDQINKMLEDKNSFLISFLCKSNTIYKMVCRSVLKKEGYYINLKFNGVKLKKRVLSVSQSFIDSNSETYRIGLMCSNDLSI